MGTNGDYNNMEISGHHHGQGSTYINENSCVFHNPSFLTEPKMSVETCDEQYEV